METITPHNMYDYWSEQLESARRAVEVAEEMVCYYALATELHREKDHDLARGLVHHETNTSDLISTSQNKGTSPLPPPVS